MAGRPSPVGIAAGIVALGAVLALAVSVRGQDRPEEGTAFAGETQVVAVEVPVQVLLDGEPVRGLTAESFRVYEGRQLRPITGFEMVDLSLRSPAAAAAAAGDGPAPPAALAVPPAGRRHFLLFFDLAFTRAGYQARALEGARSLVREGLHPSDLVGVAFYSDRRGASLVLQFTPDRTQVERVLDAFEYLLEGKKQRPGAEVAAGTEAARRPDPLGLTAGGWDTALVQVGQAAGYQTSDFAEALAAVGGKGSGIGGFLMENLLSHSAAFMEQAYEEQGATKASYLADNLKALAKLLRGIEGPKHLVLLSQGFDATLMEVRSGDSEMGSGGGSWLLRAMNDAVAELRRSGWVIHGADLGGIADIDEAEFAFQTKGSLAFLAKETGGTLIDNTNDLAVGLEDVLQRTSVTYVLTFQVAEVPEDGAFHPIRVELVDGPRGARVVHRTGYHAPRRPADQDPLEQLAQAAALILAGDEVGGLPVSLRATALSYAGESAEVPVLLEITGRDLLEGRPGDRAPELYVYAFDAGGAVGDFFARSVTLEPAGGAGASRRQLLGVKLVGALALAPGRYEIRALLRSGAGLETVRATTLEVPARGAGPSLLPPLFIQGSEERWLVAAVEGDDDREGGGDAFPFQVEGKRIAPAAVPVLAPGQAARLLLAGVGLAGEGVRLDARIVAETGEPVRPARLRILGRRAPEAGPPDVLVAELDPAGLAPGAYRLEVAIVGTAQGVSAPFRVTG
ncbi:MAG TPA: VWA domain-containing protein [Thermoanaerobaculia bacterium]|nr:VWA domain-containing protein [Thermoanaerobaculia bacterium]